MRYGEGPHTPHSETADNDPAFQTDTPATRPRGDTWIRIGAVIVVLGLTAVAFWVSYRHLYDLAMAHGEQADTARLFPLTIDGVIITASLILLYCARWRIAVPLLARAGLWSGILATLAANAAHGWEHGWTGRLISAAPAAALVLAYELLMWLIRTAKKATPDEVAERVVYRDRDVEVPVEVEIPLIAFDRFEAARWAYEDSIKDGRRGIGRRQLSDRFKLEIREAQELMDEVKREQQPEPAQPAAPESVPVPPDLPTEQISLNGSEPNPSPAGAPS